MLRNLEIGSEFETPNAALLLGAQSFLPDSCDLLGSGRQALALIASDLIDRGIRDIIVPDHHCASMVLPFVSAGFNVIYGATTSAGNLEGDQLARQLKGSVRLTAVLHNEAFGAPADQALSEALAVAEHLGFPVITDQTHSLLSLQPTVSEYQVASLRKVFPVPDGGYVRGVSRSRLPRLTDAHKRVVWLRVKAARLKSEYHAGERAAKTHLEVFSAAENLLSEAAEPSEISPISRELLSRLDFREIRRRRLANAAVLEQILVDMGVQIVNKEGWRNSPSFLVIRHPDVVALRAYLVSQGIYCPIHWPRPGIAHSPVRWRTNLLSMPIDHRYGRDDMERIGTAVSEFLAP